MKPGMLVGEFYPGGGYFTRMLSDVVGPSGHVYRSESGKSARHMARNQALLAEGKWKNVWIDSALGAVEVAGARRCTWMTQNSRD